MVAAFGGELKEKLEKELLRGGKRGAARRRALKAVA